MLKKYITAFATVVLILASLFTVVGNQVEAASYNYHTKAISVAKANLGVPYHWGGMSPSGFDCSGLIKYSYGKAGISLPHSAADMFYTKGYRVRHLHPGDLMFFAPNKASRPTHVAMYIGAGRMIMASSSKGVIITYTSNSYWKPRYIGAKRI